MKSSAQLHSHFDHGWDLRDPLRSPLHAALETCFETVWTACRDKFEKNDKKNTPQRTTHNSRPTALHAPRTTRHARHPQHPTPDTQHTAHSTHLTRVCTMSSNPVLERNSHTKTPHSRRARRRQQTARESWQTQRYCHLEQVLEARFDQSRSGATSPPIATMVLSSFFDGLDGSVLFLL